MIGAEPKFGYFIGVFFTHKISVRFVAVVSGLEDVIEPRTPQAGSFEAKVVGELDDQIREEGVEEEEEDQNPFEDCVDENQSEFVGVSV